MADGTSTTMVILRQGDERWSTTPLGEDDGFTTIGRSGCALTCVAQAALVIDTSDDVTPDELQDACRNSQAFIGTVLMFHKAAPLVGLTAPINERRALHDGHDLAELVRCLREAMDRGCAILHVDRDSGLKDGDKEGDHFILAFQIVEVVGIYYVRCYDPADGTVVTLPMSTIVGPSNRGSPKLIYKVTAVRPIRRSR